MDRARGHAHAAQVVHRAGHAERAIGHKVLGVVLNDGTPLKSVEVRVDDGPWQPATMDPATTGKYSWKLFTYTWTGATPGEHTLVSRVTDATGQVQPTAEELANKKTLPRRQLAAPEEAHDQLTDDGAGNVCSANTEGQTPSSANLHACVHVGYRIP